VRLDHLLSKELHAGNRVLVVQALGSPGVCGVGGVVQVAAFMLRMWAWVVAHGWNTDIGRTVWVLLEVRFFVCEGVGTWWRVGGGVVMDTLLGPEGAGRS
jgi:hypothetical protein